MSTYYLQRAVHHLSLPAPLTQRHPQDPAGAFDELLVLAASPQVTALRAVDLRLDLTPGEVGVIRRGDVADMYRRGVHPNTVRNFAGNFGIDYVACYRAAGLGDD